MRLGSELECGHFAGQSMAVWSEPCFSSVLVHSCVLAQTAVLSKRRTRNSGVIGEGLQHFALEDLPLSHFTGLCPLLSTWRWAYVTPDVRPYLLTSVARRPVWSIHADMSCCFIRRSARAWQAMKPHLPSPRQIRLARNRLFPPLSLRLLVFPRWHGCQ